MDSMHVDLRDTRGRLLRLATAVALGALITVLAMAGMRSVSGEPNGDPVGGSMIGFVGLLVFVLTSAAVAGTMSFVRSRRR